jgi:hypothetical protein
MIGVVDKRTPPPFPFTLYQTGQQSRGKALQEYEDSSHIGRGFTAGFSHIVQQGR